MTLRLPFSKPKITHGTNGWSLEDYDRREFTDRLTGKDLVEQRFVYQRGEEPNIETVIIKKLIRPKRQPYIKPLPYGMFEGED